MKKIVLIGGGSGGHIIPLRELADALISKKNSVELIVADKELDREMAKKNFKDIPVYFFVTDKIRRYFSFKNIIAPFRIIKSIFDAYVLIKKIKPDIVFFKGGFIGFPFLVSLLLSKFRGKIYAHESDIESGKLTLIAKFFAEKVFYSFGETPYPLFFSQTKEVKKTTNKKPQLLIFGGSQGSQYINYLIRDNIKNLTKKFNIELITGMNKKIFIPKNITGFKQREILTAAELSKKINKSDIIIARAGANSLFEIIEAKKPSLIIPLPSAANNHQEKNALFFSKQNLCHIFKQNSSDDFYKKIIDCHNDKELRLSLKSSHIKNSADKIAEEIIS